MSRVLLFLLVLSTITSISSARVAFVILGGSYSHASAPLEYAKNMLSRGYNVDWVHMANDITWIGEDAKKFNTISMGAMPPELNSTVMRIAFEQLCEQPWYELAPLKQNYFDGLWEQSYVKMLSIWGPDANSPNTNRPDILACDMFASACFDIAETLKIPYIVMVDTGLGIFGVGDNWSTPGYFNNYQLHMTFAQRFINTLFTTPAIIYRFGSVETPLNQKRAKYGVSPTLTPHDRWKGRDVLFVSYWGWEWPRYMSPLHHVIGPVFRSGESEHQLTSQLQTWMDSETTSIVYVAIGSRANLLTWHQKELIHGMQHCSDPLHPKETLRVIWVGSYDSSLSLPSNQFLTNLSWVPQTAILRHPHVRAFVTHVGVNSVQEAMHVGVPMLALPLYGDQWANAARLRDVGNSLTLDKTYFTSTQVCESLTTLIHDPKIQANVKRIQTISQLAGNGGARGADIIQRMHLVGNAHLTPLAESGTDLWSNLSALIVSTNIDVIFVAFIIIHLFIGTIKRCFNGKSQHTRNKAKTA